MPTLDLIALYPVKSLDGVEVAKALRPDSSDPMTNDILISAGCPQEM
jgi:hypothetical protein